MFPGCGRYTLLGEQNELRNRYCHIRYSGGDEKSSVKKFGEKQKSSVKILELIKQNPKITLEEIANVLGISKRAVEKQVKKLREANIIERIGSDRSGWWKIKLR